MKYVFDIDGTICHNTYGDYENAKPMMNRINQVNYLYDRGATVVYWTARGSNSGKDWSELTTKQLEEWGAKYTELLFNKPSYDVWVDDKAFHDKDFFGVNFE